jgi:hypothetical protein
MAPSLKKRDQKLEFKQLSTNIVSKAAQTVDFVSSRVKESNKTCASMGPFVTNIIELTDKQVGQIAQVLKEERCEVSLRFVKPSQYFYDRLMSVWIRLVKTLDRQMTLHDLRGAFRQRITEELGLEFEKPTRVFVGLVLEEHYRQVKLVL